MSNKQRVCSGKSKHRTYQDALREKPGCKKSRDLNIYKCKFCGFYHVGHKNNFKNSSKPRSEW